MNCLTNKISILGLCDENTEYSVLLDNYGVSLNSVAKIAPKSLQTGKALLNAIIEDGFKETLRGIRFKGMEIGRVINQYKLGVVDLTETIAPSAGTKGIEFTTSCDTTAYYLGQVLVYGNGTTTLTLDINGVSETLFTGTITEKETIYLNRLITEKEFSLLLDTTTFTAYHVDLSNCDCNSQMYCVNSTGTTNEGYGIVASVSLRCDLTNWYCQFGDMIADVAKFKVLAKIFHMLAYSDRLNDYVLFKDNDRLYELMSFYDSSFNIPALNGDLKTPPRGQFQIALDELKIPKPSCTCCEMDCVEQYQFQISTP